MYEIRPYTEPIITSTTVYPLLTEYGVESGYNSITINYFNTSVRRLYSFDNSTWYDYQDKAIRVNYGTTIYAKGIDKNGVSTNTVSLASSTPSDVMPPAVYDGNNSTGANKINGRKIAIDESMIGKKVLFYGKYMKYLWFANSSGNNISQISSEIGLETKILTVPENAKYIIMRVDVNDYLYEIRPVP